jgi:hypothetical protein
MEEVLLRAEQEIRWHKSVSREWWYELVHHILVLVEAVVLVLLVIMVWN